MEEGNKLSGGFWVGVDTPYCCAVLRGVAGELGDKRSVDNGKISMI